MPVSFFRARTPIEARLRHENAEKRIARAPVGQSIVASAEDCVAIREAARLAGHPHALCEWVPPVDEYLWE